LQLSPWAAACTHASARDGASRGGIWPRHRAHVLHRRRRGRLGTTHRRGATALNRGGLHRFTTPSTWPGSGTGSARSTRSPLYREYTDGTFSALKDRPAAWAHLGMLGPVIHAEVGDTIKVRLQEQPRPSRRACIPTALFLRQGFGGAPRTTTAPPGPTRPATPWAPGRTYTYLWRVPERAGAQEPMDPSSIMWMYHSHVRRGVGTPMPGLMGPIIVTREGHGAPRRLPEGRGTGKLVAMFMVMNENKSPWLRREHPDVRHQARLREQGRRRPSQGGQPQARPSTGEIFGNLGGLDMVQGQSVRWYLMGMGTEVDLHTPHLARQRRHREWNAHRRRLPACRQRWSWPTCAPDDPRGPGCSTVT